jgi:hypothetical protein
MLDGARKRLSANPHDVLRNLAGLKNDSAVGFLPVILLNPRAERALHDLRAIALRFLDVEFLTAIRPSHSEPAYMLDAGIDVIGYAAFVQSRYREYAGIHKNLASTVSVNSPRSSIMIAGLSHHSARRARPCPRRPAAALEPC